MLAEMREAEDTTKRFFSLPLVNVSLNLQRIPLRENNKILYDNRLSFEIFLVPYENIQTPRNLMSVYTLHLPAFFAH